MHNAYCILQIAASSSRGGYAGIMLIAQPDVKIASSAAALSRQAIPSATVTATIAAVAADHSATYLVLGDQLELPVERVLNDAHEGQ